MTANLDNLAQFFRQWDKPVVILDLETTGGNFQRDRITEIAFLHFWQGEITPVSRLVNPTIPIQAFVSQLTGIDDAMVQDAPLWPELLPDVLPYLRGSLLIAHNSRFDYTFLRQECRRAGVPFAASALCSVQLSRKLNPQFHKHSLESIIERHGLPIDSRHRAMSDVAALAQFLQLALHEKGAGAWMQFAGQLYSPRLPPPHLPPKVQTALPLFADDFGISIWRNAAGEVLNILPHEHAYREVVALLCRLPAWAAGVAEIAFEAAVGSLHAAVLCAERRLAFGGVHNEATGYHTVRWAQADNGALQAQIRPLSAGYFSAPPCGLFAYPKQAKRLLSAWAAAHGLCPRLLNILPTSIPADAPCPVVASGQTCSDACMHHDIAAHNRAVQAALADFPLGDWGKNARLQITETDELSRRQHTWQFHSGALLRHDGRWYVDKNIIQIIKHKIKQKDEGVQAAF